MTLWELMGISLQFFLDQVAGLLGAVMVLLAYFMMHAGILKNTTYFFILLNLCGGFLLFIASAVTGQLGLIFLEGTWTAISAYALVKRLRQDTVS